MSLTSPLNLASHLKPLERRPSVVPFVDFGLLAVAAIWMSSQFLFAPGIFVDLPRAEGGALSGQRVNAVLTIESNDIYLFQGALFSPEDLPEVLADYREERSGMEETLLVKADRAVALATLVGVFEEARRVGFVQVGLAAEPDGAVLSTEER